MRYRIERVRTDQGYGLGWVILDEFGDFAGWQSSHTLAMKWARQLVAEWSVVS